MRGRAAAGYWSIYIILSRGRIIIHDGIFYFVFFFCGVILYVWCSPSRIQSLDEYLGISTSIFVSGRLSTSHVSSPYAPLINTTFFPEVRVYYHTSILDVEVYPKILRKESMAVHEDNGPIPQNAYVLLSGITLEELPRLMFEAVDNVFDKHFGQKLVNPEEMRATEQRSASLGQDARQPRLAMEADVTRDTKTHKRMEDAEADQAKNGDSCSTKRVQAGPSSTSFGMKAEPPVLTRRNDVLVDIGAAA